MRNAMHSSFLKHIPGPILGLILMVVPAAGQFGQLVDSVEVGNGQGGFLGVLLDSDFFGSSMAYIGDVDKNGANDLAVGAMGDHKGAIYILFMEKDGSIKTHQKISEIVGGFDGSQLTLDDNGLGSAVAAMGDVDNDGVPDIAVGASSYGGNSTQDGAVFILRLNADGTVKNQTLITEGSGGFVGPLSSDFFGRSLACYDVNRDGIRDLLVGADNDNDTGTSQGAVWVLLLDANEKVVREEKIHLSDLSEHYGNSANLGSGLAHLGDLDGDGFDEVAMGAYRVDLMGAVYIVSLDTFGRVSSARKIANDQGGLDENVLEISDWFGDSLAAMGDVNEDGIPDLAVGARGDADGGPNRGAIWLLTLKANHKVKSAMKLSDTQGDFPGSLVDLDSFGSSIAVDQTRVGTGCIPLAVGSEFRNGTGTNQGGLWQLLRIYPFRDVGYSVDGNYGTPRLTCGGMLEGGHAFVLKLRDAEHSSFSFLIGGFSTSYAPLASGTLVPFPDIIIPLPTDGLGRIDMKAKWPLGLPACTPIWFQYWIEDTAAPFGLAASNGLRGVSAGD